ncbi:MAG: hypothetical protein R2848_05815 [Thermomicrobiales bacterium]
MPRWELLDSDPGSDAIVWSPDSARLAIAELGLLLGRKTPIFGSSMPPLASLRI